MNEPLPAGQEAVSDLLRIAAFAQSNDLLVKRHEREVRTLLNKGVGDAAIWWIALMAVAAVQGKHSECVRCADAAFKLAPSDVAVVGNAASILAGIGEIRAAVKYAKLLAEIGHRVPRNIGSAVAVCRRALCFEDAIEIMNKYGSEDDPTATETTRRLLELAVSKNVSLDKRLDLFETAVQAVRSQGCAIRQSTLEHYGDDHLRCEFYIDETPVRCGSLNRAIADALCERFDDPSPDFVTFACRPASSFHFAGSFVTVPR